MDERFGEIIRLDYFITEVTYGNFIDYDGYAYYCTDDKKRTDKEARPSDIMKGKIDRSYNYIMWFGR